MKTWTRRSLAFGGFVVGSAIGLGAAKFTCGFISLTQSDNPTVVLLANLYPASDVVKLFGRTYLDQTGETAADSLRRIECHERIQRALSSRCPKVIFSALDHVSRADFHAGRTFCIDQWVMSQTELDVAAVCTLA